LRFLKFFPHIFSGVDSYLHLLSSTKLGKIQLNLQKN